MEIAINKLHPDKSIQWLKDGWKIAKNNYSFCIGLTFIYIASGMISNIDGIGQLLSMLLNCCLFVGQFFVVQGWLEGKEAKYSTLFIVFQDNALLKKLLPLLFFNIAIGIVGLILGVVFAIGSKTEVAVGVIGLIISALSLVAMVVTNLSIPLMVRKNVKFTQAIDLSIKAATKNIIPLLAAVVISFALAIVATLVFVLPLIFWYMPMMISVSYLAYLSLFEQDPAIPEAAVATSEN